MTIWTPLARSSCRVPRASFICKVNKPPRIVLSIWRPVTLDGAGQQGQTPFPCHRMKNRQRCITEMPLGGRQIRIECQGRFLIVVGMQPKKIKNEQLFHQASTHPRNNLNVSPIDRTSGDVNNVHPLVVNIVFQRKQCHLNQYYKSLLAQEKKLLWGKGEAERRNDV